jgi:Arylsulfotransferase (ASST)
VRRERRGLARSVVLAVAPLAILGLAVSPAAQSAVPSRHVLHFSAPTLFPRFDPRVHDYVVRCHDAPLTVRGRARDGWRMAIGRSRLRSGRLRATVSITSGRAFGVTTKHRGGAHRQRYHVRCLPDDFPNYSFTRYAPVHPKYFSVELGVSRYAAPYAIIFDSHGVPMWWVRARVLDTRVLPSGKVLWAAGATGQTPWEVHTLSGRLIRTLNSVGSEADHHDLQLLGAGRYLVGTDRPRSHVDTSAYGGPPDATVTDTVLQEVTPAGGAAWRWSTFDHVALSETGRSWWWLIHYYKTQPYDVAHWNSIEADGDSVVASFRHLDAVYEIRKRTGNIVWKLGGTKTAESLRVKDDPRRYTFGNQHDARVLPDGTVTVFDDRTNVDGRPRAVRYRIDRKAGTATLVEEITDPAVHSSYCCGSARRLPGGDWLIDWGRAATGTIAGYTPTGDRTFALTTVDDSSYRAEPVPPGALSARKLRRSMRAMY